MKPRATSLPRFKGGIRSKLIKEKRPKYNIRLRDDKQYPYLCVTLQKPFPRVIRVRQTRKEGAAYFGPYADSGALNETLGVLKKGRPKLTEGSLVTDFATTSG